MDKTKLPGYEEGQKLIKLYKKAGFSDEEIVQQLATIEELVLTELIHEVEEKMNEEEKKKFDEFLSQGATPEKIAEFLKLNKEEIVQKMKAHLQKFIDQLNEELAKSELPLEELKTSLKQATS